MQRPPNVPNTYQLPAGYVYIEYPKYITANGERVIVNSREEEEKALGVKKEEPKVEAPKSASKPQFRR